jgi:hypothetical protein
MVKPPKIRHSKSRKEPLTIELGPDEVSRIEEPTAEAAPEATAETERDEAVTPVGDAVDGVAEDATSPADAEPSMSAEREAKAEDAADARPADQAPEDENAAFMGSEWPPEPAGAETPPEQERVAHAFGRDPDAPPPAASARADKELESAIRPPQASERKGGINAIAAGVIGGVVALLGAGGLQFAGLLPSPGAGVTAPADNGEAVTALKTEIAALKKEVDAVKAGSGGDTSGLSQSVTELSTGVKGLTAALDQVKADVAALKSAVAQGSAGDGAAVQALDQKLAELEASVAALGQAGSGVSQQTIDALNQKLAAVEAAAASASDAAKAGEVRLAALEQSVASLSEQVANQAGQPKVALAIAAAALKSAIERGGTFTTEVETFAAIAPNSPELPALREIAAKGIASRAELAEGMEEAANAMVAASETVSEDAGFWEQLLASAESLISVRPIGAVEGETVPAKVARMEVALRAGDLAKALAEYDTLPGPSKAAGQAFADKVRARATAEELVAKALAGALKSA